MSCDSILMAAHELFDREYDRLAQAASVEPPASGTALDGQWALWAMSRLLDSIDWSQNHTREHLELLVRHVFEEQIFVEQGGDAIIDSFCLSQLDRQVQLIVTVLEQLCSQAICSGPVSRGHVNIARGNCLGPSDGPRTPAASFIDR